MSNTPLFDDFINKSVKNLAKTYPQRADAERIKEVQQVILNKMIEGLETGQLTILDSKQVSQFVLEGTKNIQYEWEIPLFLGDLYLKWQVFEGIWDEVRKY